MKTRLLLALALIPVLLPGAEESSTIARLRVKAEQGIPGAQFNLAEMYASGYGVPKDLALAAEWYRKAAEQGFADAQFSIAMACLKGEGVPRDPVEGLAWVNIAAQAGGASLTKFREKLEQQLGPDATAAAHRRSKELAAEIEARKRARAEAR